MMARRAPLAFGTALIAAFFATLHAWRLAPTPYSVIGTQRILWAMGFVGLLLVASYASGLPEVPVSRFAALAASVGSLTVGLVGVSMAQLILGSPLLPRVFLGGVSMTFIPFTLLCWHAESDRARRSSQRVMFVGAEQGFAELKSDLMGELVPVDLIGRLQFDGSFSKRVRDAEVDMVVLDMASLADPAVVAEVTQLHREGIRVRTVSLFAEEFLGKIPLADLERMSLLFDVSELHRDGYVRWKRIVDVAICAVVFAALVPIACIIIVANRFGNPGPLLYRQDRVGKDGRIFEILKFRSMHHDAGASTNWTTMNDPRITPFGSFLRRSHIDELPQAWNILAGDLSIVGPRPEQPHYVKALTEKIPFYDVRHLVRPGLTGWAQVRYPYGADEADAREKLQYDLYYLRRQSPRVDVQILIRTIRTVVGRSGR